MSLIIQHALGHSQIGTTHKNSPITSTHDRRIHNKIQDQTKPIPIWFPHESPHHKRRKNCENQFRQRHGMSGIFCNTNKLHIKKIQWKPSSIWLLMPI